VAVGMGSLATDLSAQVSVDSERSGLNLTTKKKVVHRLD